MKSRIYTKTPSFYKDMQLSLPVG